MSQIMAFWSDREIKIPQNVVIRLNHEINNATKFNFFLKNTAKLKYRGDFIPRKLLALK